MNNLPPGCSIYQIPGNRPEDFWSDHYTESYWNSALVFLEFLEETEHPLTAILDREKLKRMKRVDVGGMLHTNEMYAIDSQYWAWFEKRMWSDWEDEQQGAM